MMSGFDNDELLDISGRADGMLHAVENTTPILTRVFFAPQCQLALTVSQDFDADMLEIERIAAKYDVMVMVGYKNAAT